MIKASINNIRIHLPRIGRSVLESKDIATNCMYRFSHTLYKNKFLLSKFSLVTLQGSPSNKHIPIIICLWNRSDRVRAILDQLDKQSSTGIDIYFWNNNYAKREMINDSIRAFTAQKSISSISIYHSRHNIGGMARFYLIRKLLSEKLCGDRAIMLDDDEDVSVGFTDDLLRMWAEKTYASLWAFKFKGSYWHREAIKKAGERADYCGTGGSIIDTVVFENDDLFTTLPDKYWFIEDLWLSAYLSQRDWNLVKVDTPVDFIDLEGNQYHGLADKKEEFYKYLQAAKMIR